MPGRDPEGRVTRVARRGVTAGRSPSHRERPAVSGPPRSHCGSRLWPRSRLLAAGVALLLLGACASAPPPVELRPESLLLTDYSSWFAADIAGNRELIAYVLGELDSDLGTVVARTDRIAGGVRLLPGDAFELSAVASGRYPRGGVQLALTLDRGFERARAQVDGRRPVFFREREGFIQLAVPASDYLYLSTGRVLDMLERRPPAEMDLDPALFARLRAVGSEEGPALLFIFDDPGRELLGSIGVEAPALPLTRIELSVTNSGDEELRLGGDLAFRTAREAELFGRVGRFFVIVLVRALGLDSAAAQERTVIEVADERVVFSEIPMSREELVGLLRSLSGAGASAAP